MQFTFSAILHAIHPLCDSSASVHTLLKTHSLTIHCIDKPLPQDLHKCEFGEGELPPPNISERSTIIQIRSCSTTFPPDHFSPLDNSAIGKTGDIAWVKSGDNLPLPSNPSSITRGSRINGADNASTLSRPTRYSSNRKNAQFPKRRISEDSLSLFRVTYHQSPAGLALHDGETDTSLCHHSRLDFPANGKSDIFKG